MRRVPEPTHGGIDFGYRNPFCALWGHLDHDDVLWVTGCRYQRQCTIPVHAEAIPKGVRYSADPAQPESIAQLRQLGHEVFPCVHRPVRLASGETKTPLMGGIVMVSERMRTGRLRIFRQACMPLVRELGMYQYDPEKLTETPIDADNHACDALRYMIVAIDRNRFGEAASADEPGPAEREARRAELDAQAQADPWDERFWE